MDITAICQELSPNNLSKCNRNLEESHDENRYLNFFPISRFQTMQMADNVNNLVDGISFNDGMYDAYQLQVSIFRHFSFEFPHSL